ncbi:hypothetical protein AYI68_g4064 [Smittium mucronatum]|uniref:Uncharacterized protein n=1 Tax=Smittium mucronatum TaxID=133383 RepID=A0A1R0GY69_9FUNG|nr:hypothetical protein AYI68_g4064 [Smittium mucronatum]
MCPDIQCSYPFRDSSFSKLLQLDPHKPSLAKYSKRSKRRLVATKEGSRCKAIKASKKSSKLDIELKEQRDCRARPEAFGEGLASDFSQLTQSGNNSTCFGSSPLLNSVAAQYATDINNPSPLLPLSNPKSPESFSCLDAVQQLSSAQPSPNDDSIEDFNFLIDDILSQSDFKTNGSSFEFHSSDNHSLFPTLDSSIGIEESPAKHALDGAEALNSIDQLIASYSNGTNPENNSKPNGELDILGLLAEYDQLLPSTTADTLLLHSFNQPTSLSIDDLLSSLQ